MNTDIFFYGLFMDPDVLIGRGVHPGTARKAFVRGRQVRVGRRAVLAHQPGARAYGMVYSLTPAEIENLYAEPGLRDYRPEAVEASLEDGTPRKVITYTLAGDPGEPDPAYAAKLDDALERLGFPDMQSMAPILRYRDARAAIAWLCAAFGMVEVFSVPESGPVVRHARLRLGSSVIMIGSVRTDDGLESPLSLGRATQALYAFVEDVDAHCARARAAGAVITSAPHDTDFGAREYHALDLERHPWTFGSHRPGEV